MRTIQRPPLFLAQFAGDSAPFHSGDGDSDSDKMAPDRTRAHARACLQYNQSRYALQSFDYPKNIGRDLDRMVRIKDAGLNPTGRNHIIRVTERASDNFADGGADEAAHRHMLGI